MFLSLQSHFTELIIEVKFIWRIERLISYFGKLIWRIIN